MDDRNEDRFVDVYKRHFPHVYAYCRRRISVDRVDDAVSETFLIAWRKLKTLPEDAKTLPWLYGIAYRVLLHKWRSGGRSRRLQVKLASLGVEQPKSAEELIVASHEASQVLEATSRLRPKDQELLRLSFWEELSHTEVADVLGLNPAAVRKRVSRALRALAGEYEKIDGKNSRSALLGKEVSGGY
ncbi:MAG: RNA polymerase sigma factor [Acidimicrobiia bacterium]